MIEDAVRFVCGRSCALGSYLIVLDLLVFRRVEVGLSLSSLLTGINQSSKDLKFFQRPFHGAEIFFSTPKRPLLTLFFIKFLLKVEKIVVHVSNNSKFLKIDLTGRYPRLLLEKQLGTLKRKGSG